MVLYRYTCTYRYKYRYRESRNKKYREKIKNYIEVEYRSSRSRELITLQSSRHSVSKFFQVTTLVKKESTTHKNSKNFGQLVSDEQLHFF